MRVDKWQLRLSGFLCGGMWMMIRDEWESKWALMGGAADFCSRACSCSLFEDGLRAALTITG